MIMETKHTFTPGPWIYAHTAIMADHAERRRVIADLRENGSRPHSRFKSRTVAEADDEDRTNGRLIAAAPTMLEALEAALPFLEKLAAHQPTTPSREKARLDALKARDAVRAALALATGATQ